MKIVLIIFTIIYIYIFTYYTGVPPEDLRKHIVELGMEDDEDDSTPVNPPLPSSVPPLVAPPHGMMVYPTPPMMPICRPHLPPPPPGMMVMRPYLPPSMNGYPGSPPMMGVMGGYIPPQNSTIPSMGLMPQPPSLSMQSTVSTMMQQPMHTALPLMQPPQSLSMPPLPTTSLPPPTPIPQHVNIRTPDPFMEPPLKKLAQPTDEYGVDAGVNLDPKRSNTTLLGDPIDDSQNKLTCQISRVRPLLDFPTECLQNPPKSIMPLMKVQFGDDITPLTRLPLVKPLTMCDKNSSSLVQNMPHASNGGLPPPTMPSALLTKPTSKPPLMSLNVNDELPANWSADKRYATSNVQPSVDPPRVREYSSQPQLNNKPNENSNLDDGKSTGNLFPAYSNDTLLIQRDDGITLMQSNMELSVEEIKANRKPYSDIIHLNNHLQSVNEIYN